MQQKVKRHVIRHHSPKKMMIESTHQLVAAQKQMIFYRLTTIRKDCMLTYTVVYSLAKVLITIVTIIVLIGINNYSTMYDGTVSSINQIDFKRNVRHHVTRHFMVVGQSINHTYQYQIGYSH